MAVAKELNLLEGDEEGKVLLGMDVEKLSDSQLADIVEKVVIYARVSPEHKLRIAQAWKTKGKVVARASGSTEGSPNSTQPP